MPVALRCETGRGRSYATGLRADARRLMALVGLAACELSIVIADDRFVIFVHLATNPNFLTTSDDVAPDPDGAFLKGILTTAFDHNIIGLCQRRLAKHTRNER